MFIWQYLDIPQNEISAIQQEFQAKLPNNDFFFQHLTIDRTHFLGLALEYTVLIQVPPMGGMQDQGIHTDIVYHKRSPLALNIPLENCEGSITKFWKTDLPINVRYTVNNVPYSYCNAEDCEKISEINFTQPFIFDSKIPHSVSNPQNVWRRAISLRFLDDPSCLIEKYGRVG